MKQKNVAKVTLGFLLFAIWSLGHFSPVYAAVAGSVVINEVAWAGSADSTNDEWIELYNTTGQPVDLTGWTINDDQGASIYTLSGTIPANGYYLIEDAENAVNPNAANIIVNLSLANTGDSLVLFDANAQMIDSVNTAGGAWFAGNATSKATMERKDALVAGDSAGNWADGSGGSGATASLGSAILGTPGALNSVSSAPVLPQKVLLQLSSATPNVGDTLTLTAKATDVVDLFSYGVELVYDPLVLTYKTSAQGQFLSSAGGVSTAFQAGLENGVAGKLLVAEARTQSVKSGVSGSGDLFTVQFEVIGGAAVASSITFGSSSFLSDPNNDLPVQFQNVQFTPALNQADPAVNARVVAGAQRSTMQLTWSAPANGATGYKIYRRDPHLNWDLLGETAQLNFLDEDAVANGGKNVPHLDYHYRIVALKNAVESTPLEVIAQETRGLKGDNNRSDRVDGRDLEKLARHFAELDTDVNFEALADTTYDGQIDGSDLIDLGVNFAKVYQP